MQLESRKQKRQNNIAIGFEWPNEIEWQNLVEWETIEQVVA